MGARCAEKGETKEEKERRRAESRGNEVALRSGQRAGGSMLSLLV